MPIPDRLFRALADDLTNRTRHWTTRQWDRHKDIVRVATAGIARFGRENVTFKGLAHALGIGPQALRHHFSDMDALLADILLTHLVALGKTLEGRNTNSDDPAASCADARQAYLDATRTLRGGFTEAHLIFTRDRHTLPPDLLTLVEQTYAALVPHLAEPTLSPEAANSILAQLDSPQTTADNVEALIATLIRSPAPAAPAETAPIPFRPLAPDPTRPVLTPEQLRQLQHRSRHSVPDVFETLGHDAHLLGRRRSG